MLIYAREVETSMEIPTPPSDAMEVINGLNAAHNDSCKIYNKRCASIHTTMVYFFYQRTVGMKLWRLDSKKGEGE